MNDATATNNNANNIIDTHQAIDINVPNPYTTIPNTYAIIIQNTIVTAKCFLLFNSPLAADTAAIQGTTNKLNAINANIAAGATEATAASNTPSDSNTAGTSSLAINPANDAITKTDAYSLDPNPNGTNIGAITDDILPKIDEFISSTIWKFQPNDVKNHNTTVDAAINVPALIT